MLSFYHKLAIKIIMIQKDKLMIKKQSVKPISFLIMVLLLFGCGQTSTKPTSTLMLETTDILIHSPLVTPTSSVNLDKAVIVAPNNSPLATPLSMSSKNNINFEDSAYRVTNSTTITLPDIQYVCCPSWSPDRQKIAFGTFYNMYNDVYTMNVDGSEVTKIFSLKAAHGDYLGTPPYWSPDGKRISFIDYDGRYNVIDVDGTNLIELGHGAGWSWSPDGQHLVFSSSPKRENGEIYVLDVIKNNLKTLSPHNLDDKYPLWSPDGQSIVFSSNREDNNYEIYSIDSDGTNLRRLTDNLAEDLVQVWSPDGRYITFISDRDGVAQIYVMDKDGGNVKQLTDSPSPKHGPVWSPDGRYIAFYAEPKLKSPIDSNGVYVINSDGTNLTWLMDVNWQGFVWVPTSS